MEKDGRLRVETAGGTVHFTTPVAWQPRPDGGQDPVEVAYVAHGDRYGFRLGPHDPKRGVIIDPLLGTALLRASAVVRDMTVDTFGDVFIVGSTNGSNLQTLANGTYDTTADGAYTRETSGYIAKFSRDLEELLALTFLDGGEDYAFTVLTAIVSNREGDVFVAGITNSQSFPIVDPNDKTTSSLRQAFGGYEFVVARLSNDLTQLTASAYISGSRNEGLFPNAHQVDLALAPDEQSLYFAGTSNSTDLPTNQGGPQNEPAYMAVDPHPTTGNDLGYDCYLAQLPLDLTDVNATWVGNDATDGDWRMYCYLVGTDGIGSVFVSGYGYGQFESGVSGHARSQSSDPDSPYGDWGDVVVARFSPDLRTLKNGTFLGAFDGCFQCDTPDRPWDMLVTLAGSEVILVGQTSTEAFPTTPGALFTRAQNLDAFSNSRDETVGFVARLDNDLNLMASTLLHNCPRGDEGVPDCDKRGHGFATAVDYYNYRDENNRNRRDFYVVYAQDPGLFSGGLTTNWPGAYMSLPLGNAVGPVSLYRLNEELTRILSATDLVPHYAAILNEDEHYHTALTFSESYYDINNGNKHDPRVYTAFSISTYPVRHPRGFNDPRVDVNLGSLLADSGPYVIALDPDLSAGDSPALAFTSTEPLDLGYLPEGTTSAPIPLTVINNSSNRSLTVYRDVFESNGKGGYFGYGSGTNRCFNPSGGIFPFDLSPGTSCTLYLTVNGTATDPYVFEGRLHLLSNDPNGSRITSPDITVRATPLLLQYPGSSIYAIDYLGEGLDFGSVDVGDNIQRTVTAQSRIDNLELGQVVLEDPTAPFTIEQDNCSNKTLNNADTCTVTLRYQPTSAGAHETILGFKNTLTSGAYWVALRLGGSAQDAAGAGGSGGSGSTGGSGGSAGSGGGGASGGSGGNTGGSGGGNNTGGGGSSGILGLATGPLPVLAGLILVALAWYRRRA